MKKIRLGFAILMISLIPLGQANAQDKEAESESIDRVTKLQVNPSAYQLWAVLNHPKVPKYARTTEFWEAVALCESSKDGKNPDWKDGGYYAGGTGMALSTWRGYGGWEFARRPDKATKNEQIIVATRVAFIGYQTKNSFITLEDKLNNKPFFRPAAGMNDWGGKCVTRYIASWKRAQIERCPKYEPLFEEYGLPKEFSQIAWRESRCNPRIISDKNSNGSRDYGLLQINSSWKTLTSDVCGTEYGNMKALLRVRCNVKVAKWLLDNTKGGMHNWSSYTG